jgi:catechol 2,3-dioxygenase-like lactoylglutathione lyase family enzyme
MASAAVSLIDRVYELDQPREPNLKLSIPFFGVKDIETSLRFYVDGLGFTMTRHWSPEGRICWSWLERDQVAIMLQEYSKDGRHGGSPEGEFGLGVVVCIFCADAITVYHDALARGIDAKRPFVGNHLWVTSVRDPDGYGIDFESPTEVPEGTEYSG